MRNRLVPKMNDLDLCLEVVYGHVNHCITFATELSWKPLELLGSKGPSIGNSLWEIKWSRDQ